MYYLYVVGSRDFKNHIMLNMVLTDFINQLKLKDVIVISGGAKGADSFAVDWANANSFSSEIFHPQWKRPDGSYNKAAGFERNKKMRDYFLSKKEGACFAFWDGLSKGTKENFNSLKNSNKTTWIIRYDPIEQIKYEIKQL